MTNVMVGLGLGACDLRLGAWGDNHRMAHLYPIRMTWTGNTGTGTADYCGYDRTHERERSLTSSNSGALRFIRITRSKSRPAL